MDKAVALFFFAIISVVMVLSVNTLNEVSSVLAG